MNYLLSISGPLVPFSPCFTYASSVQVANIATAVWLFASMKRFALMMMSLLPSMVLVSAAAQSASKVMP